MDQLGFGDILRQTRERKGLDLNATARRLRIRPDILKAIEEGNFAAMPPRGYSRNMVNGYARYLGLNPTDITGKYLDELYAYQVGAARAVSRSTGIDMSEADNSRMGRTSRNQRVGNRDSESRPSRSQDNRRSDHSHRGEDARMSDTRKRRSSGREDESPRSGSRSRSQQRSASGSESSRRSSRSGQRRQTDSVAAHNAYTSFYTGPQNQSIWRKRLPYILAAAIILLIIIIVGVLLFGNKGSGSQDAVPNVPVSGVADNQATQDETTQTQTASDTAPTKFTFSYTVAEGTTSWIEVIVDDEVKVAQSVTGPVTESFDCSGTLEFICANPTGVTAQQDGSDLTLTSGTDGVVDLTINFSDVLKQWIADHPDSQAAKDASASEASAATVQDATSSITTDASSTSYDSTYGTDASGYSSYDGSGASAYGTTDSSTYDTYSYGTSTDTSGNSSSYGTGYDTGSSTTTAQ